MELWIRSQDKTTLIRSYEIYISEQQNTYLIRAKRTSHILGSYSTIERAIEVLDEIHKCIVDKEVLDGCNNILTLANTNSLNEIKQILDRAEKIAVYEMPEK